MSNKILMYLFIFVLITGIFIYVNDKKILDAKQARIENLEADLSDAEAKNTVLNEENSDLNYFNLSQNEQAITYFEKRGIDAIALAQKVEDAIISMNKADEDNQLVPFEGIEGPMRVNKVKILNHKWIIADFTDGKYWGEILISYGLDDNNQLQFNTENSFLYPID